MKNKKNINIRALLLLLIYIFSNSPAIMFHHHNHEKVVYENATSCEKNIYFGDKSGKCEHNSHISKAIEKCFLCDHHNLASHLLETPFLKFFKIEFPCTYVLSSASFNSNSTSEASNRGPPTV